MKFIVFFLLIGSVCFGQAKDSAKHKVDTAAIKQQQQQVEATVQAINYVLADMKATLYGVLNADDYAALIKIQEEYIKKKTEQFSPKPKK